MTEPYRPWRSSFHTRIRVALGALATIAGVATIIAMVIGHHEEIAASRLLLYTLPGVVGVGLIVALLISPLTTWATAPLDRLVRDAKKISEGDLKARLAVNRDDAVGRLTAAINHLAETADEMLRDKETLLATVSHEVRSPLARIKVIAELLEAVRQDPSSHRDTLSDLDREVEAVDQLMQRLLIASRTSADPRPLNRRPVDLQDWLQRAIRTATPKAKTRNIALALFADEAPEYIHGDPDLLDHTLTNLVNNAVRHARTCMNIRVSTTTDSLVVHVDDDGKGITPDRRAEIFQPFSRSVSGGAAGLGLKIALGVAERHGGTIEITDSPEGGARFTLMLPIR